MIKYKYRYYIILMVSLISCNLLYPLTKIHIINDKYDKEIYEGYPIILSISIVNNTDVDIIVPEYNYLDRYKWAMLSNAQLFNSNGLSIQLCPKPIDNRVLRPEPIVKLSPKETLTFTIDLRKIFTFPLRESGGYKFSLLNTDFLFEILPIPGKIYELNYIYNYNQNKKSEFLYILSRNKESKYELLSRLKNYQSVKKLEMDILPSHIYIFTDYTMKNRVSSLPLSQIIIVVIGNDIIFMTENQIYTLRIRNIYNLNHGLFTSIHIDNPNTVSIAGKKHSIGLDAHNIVSFYHFIIESILENDNLVYQDLYISIARNKYNDELVFITKEEYTHADYPEEINTINPVNLINKEYKLPDIAGIPDTPPSMLTTGTIESPIPELFHKTDPENEGKKDSENENH